MFNSKPLSVCTLVAGLMTATVASAQIVLNEIHYNPPDSFEEQNLDVEFLELYNASETAFDLSGASFTGINFIFPEGSVIGADQFLVLSPEYDDAQAVWGITPFGIYSGGLSGKGESIQLIGADGTVILDAVTYDDKVPWPGAPDGDGSSLELLNPALDNSLAENWMASEQLTPSPGMQNSVYTPDSAPTLRNAESVPKSPNPQTPFQLQVEARNALDPHFYYRVNTGEEAGPIPLMNLSGDIWSGTVPAQEGGTLVRYRFVNGAANSPATEDTRNYFGVVVADTDTTTSQLPVLQFFISEADYTGLYDTPLDDDEFQVVVAYGDQVIDNARIRIRGASSRARFLKKNFKIELPDGYAIEFGEHSPYALDEFALQADRGDVPFNSTLFAWDAAAEEGEPDIANFHIRLEKNADFYGLYRLQEVYDASYRAQHDKDDGELFKAVNGGFNVPNRTGSFVKKNPDDGNSSSMTLANEALRNLDETGLKSWVYDNVDVPAMINYSALTSLLRHGDQEQKNYYAYIDDDTERWSMLFWDLDQTWLYGSAGPCPQDGMTIPTCLGNPLLNAVLNIPEFEAMHWRRTRTLVDKWLYVYDLEARREEVISRISVEEAEFDLLLWGEDGKHWDSNLRLDPYYRNRWEIDSLQRRRIAFENEPLLPYSPGELLPVVINEIHYHPAEPNVAEYIELHNPNSVAVDISGWTLEDAVELEIRHGTVAPAGGYVVFTDEDLLFRNENPGDIFVAGQFSGGLKNAGERIALSDNAGILVDEVVYENAAPWPVAPDGLGFSLSLVTPDSDNLQPSSWVASAVLGGTPGFANSTEAVVPVLSLVSQTVNEEDANIQVNVTFTLSSPAPSASQFTYSTTDGSAISGVDYEASAGTLYFDAGSTESEISVTIYDTTEYADDRGFSFIVAAVENGIVGDIGDIVIVDDELPPDVTAPVWVSGNLTLLDKTSQTLELQWEGASDNVDVVSYAVYLTTSGVAQQRLTTQSSSIVLTDLEPSTDYSIRVEALDLASNESVDGPVLQAMTDNPPDITSPLWSSPVLIADNETMTSMDLRWQGASDDVGIVGYKVTIASDGGEPYSLLVASQSFTISDLLENTLYTVSVQALDAAGNLSTNGPVTTASTVLGPSSLIVELDSIPTPVLLEAASGQDAGQGGASVGLDGNHVTLQGNAWKRVEINYNVTRDTVLEFDFHGQSEGEVHAIGLETNSVVSSSLTFQLWGTQRFGKRTYNNYDQSAGQTVRYRIPIGQLVSNRTYPYLTLTSDKDRGPFENSSTFSNISLSDGTTIEVDTEIPTWSTPMLSATAIAATSVNLDWSNASDNSGVSSYEVSLDGQVAGMTTGNAFTIENLIPETEYTVAVEAIDSAGNRSTDGPQIVIATIEEEPADVTATKLSVLIDNVAETFDVSGYGKQDRNGESQLRQEGREIQLEGNTWKYIDTDLVISDNTVLSFDFSSTSEGAVHGVALETNLYPSSSKTFKVFGTKRFGVRDFDTYSNGDGTVRVSIPIGQYLRGRHRYLVFINDHDVRDPDAKSVYSNIAIESSATSP